MLKLILNILCVVSAIALGALGMRAIKDREIRELLARSERQHVRPSPALPVASIDKVQPALEEKTSPIDQPSAAELSGDAPTPVPGPSPQNHPYPDYLHAKAVAKVDRIYGALFEKILATGGNPQRLREELTAMELIGMDGFEAANQLGYDFKNPPSLKPLVATIGSVRKEYKNQMRAEVGEAVYNALMDYEHYLPERSVANLLEQTLRPTAFPLTAEQKERFIDILGKSKDPGQPREITTSQDGPIRRIPNAAVEQLRPVLLPAQLAALQEIQQAQQRRRTLVNGRALYP